MVKSHKFDFLKVKNSCIWYNFAIFSFINKCAKDTC